MTIRRFGAVLLVALGALAVAGCAENPPSAPPATGDQMEHVTVWTGLVPHSEAQPPIARWQGYGTFLYNDMSVGGCGAYDGEFDTVYERVDASTVRMTVTFTWTEQVNHEGNYGCFPQSDLHVGIFDAADNELAFVLLELDLHT
jgi:hypothetical protein